CPSCKKIIHPPRLAEDIERKSTRGSLSPKKRLIATGSPDSARAIRPDRKKATFQFVKGGFERHGGV
ncbi:MAG: hypothetical protein ACC661_05765, partial [Verrucomicrobiales bacterium]